MDNTKPPITLISRPHQFETLSAREYLELSQAQRAKIQSASIVPARLGGADFGGVRVVYKSPIYKVD
jgi:hypothetical protein